MAVAADGQVHPAEHQLLVRVARRLGLTERDVAQLEALLRVASPGAAGGGAAGGGAPSRARIESAYAALGVTAKSSDNEIKRAYRRLMSQNHPDKLAARGLPESMREIAEERTREINSAYDLVKEARRVA
jgi:DnaJ like chaperone protein